LAIFAGGGFGAVLRYALSVLLDQRFPGIFPWGTFAVNMAGCLLIGALATLADERALLSPGLRFALITGVPGGFTTYSTFGLETWRLIEEGRVLVSVAYSLGSLGTGVTAVALGVYLARNVT
jgi:CrcB protein